MESQEGSKGRAVVQEDLGPELWLPPDESGLPSARESISINPEKGRERRGFDVLDEPVRPSESAVIRAMKRGMVRPPSQPARTKVAGDRIICGGQIPHLASNNSADAGRGLGATAEGDTPRPLLRQRPRAEEPPLECLGPLRPAVGAVAAATQAPTALALQSVLGVASLAVRAHADVETLAGQAPVVLFLLTVARSGERKTGCDMLALKGVREVEQERLAAFPANLARAEAAMELHQADRAAILRSRDTIARDTDLEALASPPEPPLAPHVLFVDLTFEGFYRHFDTGQPSVGIFSDEGRQVLGGHAMSQDAKVRSVTAFSKFWDGAPTDRVRASGPARHYFGRRLSCHPMIQPAIADGLLADPMMRDQGILARFLIAWPESTVGERLITEDTRKARTGALEALEPFHIRIRAILETRAATTAGGRELAPRLLRLSPGPKPPSSPLPMRSRWLRGRVGPVRRSPGRRRRRRSRRRGLPVY